ncbi:MAG: gas vesicle protein GvpG [Pseudomonadota bacterium]
MALFRLLALPVTGPMRGTIAIARAVEEAARRELCDPAAIRAALQDLERQLESGEIDEATFDAAEDTLIARLRDSENGAGETVA